MALIKCTECGHEMSDKAAACPHCGCPNEIVEREKRFNEEWQEICAKHQAQVEESKNRPKRGMNYILPMPWF